MFITFQQDLTEFGLGTTGKVQLLQTKEIYWHVEVLLGIYCILW
jgi:hypothetical protein